MNRIIEFALGSRLLVLALGLLVAAAGWRSYTGLPVDAFPDVSPNLVQIFTETEGLSPEDVEKYVTYPVETAMNGLPSLEKTRSVSNFGLSVVNVYAARVLGRSFYWLVRRTPRRTTGLRQPSANDEAARLRRARHWSIRFETKGSR